MKHEAHVTLVSSGSEKEEVMEVQYKSAKREAKKIVTMAKNKVYKRLYQKLEPKEGEREVFRLA